MRTLRQFSCAKSAASTLCLATCRSTSPSIKTRRSVTCSDKWDVQKTWSVLHPLSNQVGPSRLCSTRRTVLKAPAPRKLIDFKSDNVTSVQPMTICCVWCEIGKPNNEKQPKTAFTKDTLKLLNYIINNILYTSYWSDWNCRILFFKDPDWTLLKSWGEWKFALLQFRLITQFVSSHVLLMNLISWDDQIWSSLHWPTQSPIRACVLNISHAAHASAKSEFWTKEGRSCFNSIDKFMTGWGCAKHPATWQISSTYFLLIECDNEFPSQFHQVTPASWMLMRYSKSRRIFSVMICLKGMMDVWWVETHEIPWVWSKDLMFQGLQGI